MISMHLHSNDDLRSLHPSIDRVFERGNPSESQTNQMRNIQKSFRQQFEAIPLFTSFYPCPNQCWSNSGAALAPAEIFQMHTFCRPHYSRFARDILANRPCLRQKNSFLRLNWIKWLSISSNSSNISYQEHFYYFHPNRNIGKHLWAHNIAWTMFSIDCPISKDIHSNRDVEYCSVAIVNFVYSFQAMDRFAWMHDSWRQSNDSRPLQYLQLNKVVYPLAPQFEMKMVDQFQTNNFQPNDSLAE